MTGFVFVNGPVQVCERYSFITKFEMASNLIIQTSSGSPQLSDNCMTFKSVAYTKNSSSDVYLFICTHSMYMVSCKYSACNLRWQSDTSRSMR